MKKFTLRTAVMAVVTVLVLTAVAFAANEVINPTVVPTPITQFQPVDSREGTQEEISPSPMATRRPIPDFDEVILSVRNPVTAMACGWKLSMQPTKTVSSKAPGKSAQERPIAISFGGLRINR